MKTKKHKTKICCSECGKPKAKGRSVSMTCYNRNWRERNPIKNAFNNIKNKAKRRYKEFSIDLKYFTDLVNGTDYIEKKGLTAQSLTIDRIINEIGYVEGNLRITTKSENSSKGVKTMEEWQAMAKELAAVGIHIAVGGGDSHPF